MRYTTIFATLLLCPSALSQGSDILPPTRGPFASISLALSVNGAAGLSGSLGLHPAAIAISWAGNQVSVPSEYSGFTPDMRRNTMFSGITLQNIDAWSSGNDFLADLDHSSGMIEPQFNWLALLFSVVHGSEGEADSALRAHHDNRKITDDIGGDVLSTFFAGSDGIPPKLINNSLLLEQLGTEQNIKKSELVALDVCLPLTIDDPDYAQAIDVSTDNFYFSLSRDMLTGFPSSWWGGLLPSGATILVSSWNTASGTWNSPVPYKTYEQLGLNHEDEIDALAVDDRTEPHVVVYSLSSAGTEAPGTTENDLLCFRADTVPANRRLPIKDENGILVTKKLRLSSSDNMDAICFFDPEDEQVDEIPGPQPLPLPLSSLQDQDLGLSLWKSHDTEIVLTLSGFAAARADSVLEFFVSNSPDLSYPISVGAVLRLSSEDTKELTFPVPPGIPARIPGGRGVPFYVMVKVTDLVSSSVSAPYMFLIEL